MYYDITEAQHEALLKPLNPVRIAKRSQSGKQLSYLEAWDVKAHLNRIFGFIGWSWTVTQAELAFEGTVLSKNGSDNWNVGYKVLGTLEVAGARYSEAAVGSSTLPSRGDAHDMAVKTAESDALKRAAINLGDQFGLSLYNNGSTKPVVGRTLYGPWVEQERLAGIQGALQDLRDTPELPVVPVEASVSDEEAPEPSHGETQPPEPQEAASDSVEAAAEALGAETVVVDVEAWATRLRECIATGDVPGIVKIKSEMAAEGILDVQYKGKTLAKLVDVSVVAAGKKVK